MCFYYDDDCSFSTRDVRRARKQYECADCTTPIMPGDVHEHAAYVFDGSFYTQRRCARCHFIAAAIASVERSRGCEEYEAWPAWGDLERAWDDDPEYAIALGVAVPIEPDDPEGGLTAPNISELPRW